MATPQTSTRPARGAELELTVDTLAHGGNGVARLDGYVVFVAGALPGDRVRAVVGKSKRAYAEARAVEILEPSPDRIAPVADHPGAPWQVLRYERQLEVKAEQVGDALRRIGKLDGFEQDPIVPAVEQWRYRNKLEYSFGTDADGTLVCGFHAPGRYDEILPMTDCLLASERGNAAREQVLAWAREQGLSAWDRRDQRGLLRNLVVREGRRTGELQVRLVTSPGAIDTDRLRRRGRLRGPVLDPDGRPRRVDPGRRDEEAQRLQAPARAARRPRVPASRPRRSSRRTPRWPRSSTAPRSSSPACAATSASSTSTAASARSGSRSPPRAREVVGVEIVEPAVADAIDNARRNEITNARFFAGDIRLAMRDLVEEAGKPDVAVIDPPRAGLSQKVVRRIVESAPKRIVYVSCNPTTLAPNAAQLVEAGYELKRVRPVDMFPQTPHIERVALLEAGPNGVANPPRDD